MVRMAVNVAVSNLWERPDAILDIDLPMTGKSPDPAAWTAALTRDQKLALRGRVATQLLLGEPVEVVREEGELSLVTAPWQPSDQDPAGYPGWVLSEHLAEPPTTRDNTAVVTADTAPLLGRTGRLSYGTALPVRERNGGEVVVELPGGDRGTLSSTDCVVRPTDQDRTVDPAQVVSNAHRFIGLEYLWGGMSAYGLDCSGLVHLCFRALGLVIPRDAHDQSDAAEQVDRATARTGDLYFFARPGKGIHHVGLALPDAGPNHLLHAPQTGQGVVAEPMSPDRSNTLLNYVGRFVS